MKTEVFCLWRRLFRRQNSQGNYNTFYKNYPHYEYNMKRPQIRANKTWLIPQISLSRLRYTFTMLWYFLEYFGVQNNVKRISSFFFKYTSKSISYKAQWMCYEVNCFCALLSLTPDLITNKINNLASESWSSPTKKTSMLRITWPFVRGLQMWIALTNGQQ